MSKVALITGVTGQDGSYLAEFLLEKGYEVHGIKRRASSFNTERVDHIYQDPHTCNPKFHLHYGDLSDTSNLTRILREVQPDEVYNLGAMSHVAVSFESPEYTADVDAMGTLRLLEASHMSFLGPKTASVKYAKGYKAVLKRLGYRLRVTELKLTPCADGVYAELTVANEGAAPFYWDWPVNLYVEDTAGSILCTARLPLSLPELMPGKSQKVSVTLEGADAQELLCGGWKRLFRSPKHLTIGIVDPMTSRDAVRFAMKAARKNGRTVLL